MDSVLKKFSDVSDACFTHLLKTLTFISFSNVFILLSPQARYKDKYENEVKGHYIGSYEDIFMLHCQRMEEMKNEVGFPDVSVLFLLKWM